MAWARRSLAYPGRRQDVPSCIRTIVSVHNHKAGSGTPDPRTHRAAPQGSGHSPQRTSTLPRRATPSHATPRAAAAAAEWQSGGVVSEEGPVQDGEAVKAGAAVRRAVGTFINMTERRPASCPSRAVPHTNDLPCVGCVVAQQVATKWYRAGGGRSSKTLSCPVVSMSFAAGGQARRTDV
ncbi:hypothetical protein E2C01_088926 [Portunus trituberculatus]|uniref:Uncharacterized protein n=1 Tax=Portunus trituberculatus TaxID=210409 RepID=A0A5B7JN70_PORTR|nr:hypothetical protein [Portunus trituberculatus]